MVRISRSRRRMDPADQPEFFNLNHFSASVWPRKKLKLMEKCVSGRFPAEQQTGALILFFSRVSLANRFFLILTRPVADTTHSCISAATNIQINIFGCVAIVGRIEWFSLINWAKGIHLSARKLVQRTDCRTNLILLMLFAMKLGSNENSYN